MFRKIISAIIISSLVCANSYSQIIGINIGIPQLQYLMGWSPKINGVNSWYNTSANPQSAYTNGAVSFTGTDNAYLSAPSNAGLNTGNIDFQIGAWIYPTSSAIQIIVQKGNNSIATAGYEFQIYQNSGGLYFYVSNGTTSLGKSSGGLTLNAWHFFKCWHDSTAHTYNVQVDQNAVQSVADGGIYPQVTSLPLSIGNDANASYPFTGRLASLYYTKTLTSGAQDTALYNAGNGLTFSTASANSTLTSWMSSLVSWWNMDEPVGIRYDSITASANNLAQTFNAIISPTILNGGFESSSTLITPWIDGSNGTSSVTVSSTQPYAGTYCGLFTNDAGGDAAIVTQSFNLTAGHAYSMFLFAKYSSGTPTIAFGDANISTTAALTAVYKQYTGYFTATASNPTIQVTGSSATSRIDNVTLTATAIYSGAGLPSQLSIDGNLAASFNGTTQYLSVASNSSLSPSSSNFSIWGWFNLSVMNPTINYVIAGKYGTVSSNIEYLLDIYASNLSFLASANGTTSSVATISTVTLQPNTWYLAIGWYDGAHLNISLNNANTTSSAYSSGTYVGSSSFNVGSIGDGTFNFKGLLDGVGFMKRTLTAGEQTAIFNAGHGVKYAGLPSTVKTDSSLSFYNLDEYSTGTAPVTRKDSTINANNLTDSGNTPSGQGVNYFEGTVSTFLDSSINGNTLTQATQANRLMWSTNVQNGQPALVGDGLTKNLSNAADLIGTGNITAVFAFKARGWGGINNGSLLNNSKFKAYVVYTNATFALSRDGSTSIYSANSSIALNTNYVVVVTSTSAGVTNIYINGVLSGSANQAAGTPAAGTPTYLGNVAALTSGFDGWIYDEEIYPSILNTVQISAATTRIRKALNF